MSKRFYILGPSLAVLGALTVAMPVLAEGAPPAGGNNDFAIEEVIVTAQKRAENLQNVPISITALSAAALEKSGVTALDGLQRYAPGLTMATVGSGFVSYTYLRGSGTNQVDAGSDPSVAFFVDEVYVAASAGMQFDLFDIDRIEVLKGPQGTLFGRNAAAGAISITTQKPSPTFNANLTADAGDYGYHSIRATVTGPLNKGGSLRFRISGAEKERDAFTKNLAAGRDPGNLKSAGGRGQIEYVGEKVTFLLSGDYISGRNGMTNQFLSTANKAGILTAAAIAALPVGDSFYAHYYNVDGYENQNIWSLTGRLTWETPIGNLTSISAYRSNKFNRLQDQDGTLADAFSYAAYETDKTFSQELRLANEGPKFNWLAGLYFYDNKTVRNDIFGAGPAFAVPALQNHIGTDFSQINSKSYAAFAQATYHFTNQIGLTAGARYSIDKKEDLRTVKGYLAVVPYMVDPHARWSSLDPSVTLNFKPTQDVLSYISYRRGFKSGGFQTSLPATAAIANTPFEPEHVNSYEAGIKSEWFNHRLQVNAALFWADVVNQQILRIIAVSNTSIDNAGATRTKGVDLAITMMPVRGLRLDANMTYQEARFRKYQTGAVSYAGFSQLRSPDFMGSYAAEYTVDVGDKGALSLRGEYIYQTKAYFDAANTQTLNLNQPGYGITNGRITFTPSHGNWELSVWGKNLTDEKYFRNIAIIGPTGLAVPGDPRTFGVSIHLNFD